MYGRYRAIELVGRGSMAHVYRAEHLTDGKRFALKLLVGPAAEDEGMRERFPREAAAIRGVTHPNVVALVDFGTEGDLLYLVMEWVEGLPLSEVIEREAPFDPTRAARIGRQLSQGLEAIHRHGFIHRDLKPQNVMLTVQDGAEVPKIVDFGLVANPDWTRLTETGCLVGTPLYMAPEVIEGRGASAKSDLYSLGVILYQMLAGRVPFSGPTIHDILHKHLFDRPISLVGAGGLEAVVRAMLEKREEDRPQDASAVAAIMGALLAKQDEDLENLTTVDSELYRKTVSSELDHEARTPITLPGVDAVAAGFQSTASLADGPMPLPSVETVLLPRESPRPPLQVDQTLKISALQKKAQLSWPIVIALLLICLLLAVWWMAKSVS